MQGCEVLVCGSHVAVVERVELDVIFPAFYLHWLRPAVFASALWTDVSNSESRQNYQSVGGQVDLRFSVLHWYEMTLSAGYAVGFRDARRAGSEWMVSLKIL